MFNPSLSMNSKAKLKPLDFSNLSAKNLPPTFAAVTSPSTQDSQQKLPLSKTSVNSPQSHPKYNLFERNGSVNASPSLPQKSMSFIPSIQNLKEMEITFKNDGKEVLSSLTAVNKDGPFYFPSSSSRLLKPKSDDSVEAPGPMSTNRLNVTKERKQRQGFNNSQQQFILMNSERPLITLQPDSPINQSRLLSQTKESRNEKGSKVSLKNFSSIKLESVLFDNNKKDSESPTAGKSSKGSVKSPKNAKISRTARLNLVSQVLKTNPDEQEHQKGAGETISRTKKKIVLSPLASTAEYTLLDRERIRKQTLSNKKNLKIMLDSQAIKCFEEVKTSVAGSLSFRPQVQLFPIHTNDRKFPKLVREDINGLKDLCKLILPSKLLS